MIDQIVKVHPDGVIWVVNSSEMLLVLSKNGSGGHKFQNNIEMPKDVKFVVKKSNKKKNKFIYHETNQINRVFKLGLTYSWSCQSSEHHGDDEEKQ